MIQNRTLRTFQTAFFQKKQRQDCRNFAFADGHVESINGYKLIDGGVSGNGYKFSAFWMKGKRFGQHTN